MAFVDEIGRFDRMNPATWDLAGIDRCWREREENYNGLIVLTVIDENVIRRQNSTHEDFALALKQRLIHHYWIDKDDDRIRNREGDQGQQGHPGYAVYMAVRIERGQEGQRGRWGRWGR